MEAWIRLFTTIWSDVVASTGDAFLSLIVFVLIIGGGWIVFKGLGAWLKVWVGHASVKDEVARSGLKNLSMQLQDCNMQHEHCKECIATLNKQMEADRDKCEQRLSALRDEMFQLLKTSHPLVQKQHA